jgi:hypothetical protein
VSIRYNDPLWDFLEYQFTNSRSNKKTANSAIFYFKDYFIFFLINAGISSSSSLLSSGGVEFKRLGFLARAGLSAPEPLEDSCGLLNSAGSAKSDLEDEDCTGGTTGAAGAAAGAL